MINHGSIQPRYCTLILKDDIELHERVEPEQLQDGHVYHLTGSSLAVWFRRIIAAETLSFEDAKGPVILFSRFPYRHWFIFLAEKYGITHFRISTIADGEYAEFLEDRYGVSVRHLYYESEYNPTYNRIIKTEFTIFDILEDERLEKEISARLIIRDKFGIHTYTYPVTVKIRHFMFP